MMKKMVSLLTACLVLGICGAAMGATALDPGLAPLGERLFFDNLSDPDSMACAECHAPNVGWTGPTPGINLHGAVYRGAVPQRFGNRKPPASGYAAAAPVFYYDQEGGLFIGGNFWDGRATGWGLGNPAADQALGPFLNPVEQNNADREAVVGQVCSGKYADLFISLFNAKVSLVDPCDPANVEAAYHFIGLAIAAYEDSPDVSAFTSKYDAFLAGETALTGQEALGLELFQGKAKCALCHPNEEGPNGEPPLFTDFSYDNLGVPKNEENPFYDMDEVFLDNGEPINPAGEDWVDPGLGGFLQSLAEAGDPAVVAGHWRNSPYLTNVGDFTDEQLLALAAENYGKHKVPTLRNVAKRPGQSYPKAYTHNGVFKSLAEVVEYYDERDAMILAGTATPEVWENMNVGEIGELGLTDAEEAALVAFLETLSDGWRPPKRK